MPDINAGQPRTRGAHADRRRPDPTTVQTWEALEATGAELMAANAKLTSANLALDAAREREHRLLEIIEKSQVRLHRLLAGMAATTLVIVLLLLFVAFNLKA